MDRGILYCYCSQFFKEEINIPPTVISCRRYRVPEEYEDTFVSDRVKRNIDLIRGVKVEEFYRKDMLSAVLWYPDLFRKKPMTGK